MYLARFLSSAIKIDREQGFLWITCIYILRKMCVDVPNARRYCIFRKHSRRNKSAPPNSVIDDDVVSYACIKIPRFRLNSIVHLHRIANLFSGRGTSRSNYARVMVPALTLFYLEPSHEENISA